MLELSEQVDVWVLFSKSKIQPSVFFWKGRQIKIDKINLVHSSRDGSNHLQYFSVSSQGNFYRLRLEVERLKWVLEAVEEG